MVCDAPKGLKSQENAFLLLQRVAGPILVENLLNLWSSVNNLNIISFYCLNVFAFPAFSLISGIYVVVVILEHG